jgi:Protein of unknown function (DUF3987)
VSLAEEFDPPPDEFWDARPALRHIRDFAYARMCSPWAVLGATILHVLHFVPPWVTLPALIGGRGSLNLFVALVGPTGAAKGAAERAAEEAFDLHHEPVHVAALGSGEGLVHQYAHFEKGQIVRDRNAVIFVSPEIDGLTALHSRQGSTLTSQLRSAFSGERLGFSYADRTRRIPLEAHSYRLGLVVGVQPERAAALLDQSDGGTPQRFVWLPATDSGVTADPPATPKPMPIAATCGEWKTGHLSIPDQVAREIREAHVARMQGDGDALDGHALFCREKAAIALALLDDRRVMNLEDWELAGKIMAKSDAVRTSVINTLQRRAKAKETARALEEGRRDVIKGQVVRDEEFQRACNAVTKKLRREGDWVTGAVARQAIASNLRHHFTEAVDKLEETGQIEVENVDHYSQQGIRLRIKQATK